MGIRKAEPLLFVNSPVIVQRIVIPTVKEESTSVFEMSHEKEAERIAEPIVKVEADALPEQDQPVRVPVSPLLNMLEYLSGSFQKQVYQPLEIVCTDQVVKGSVYAMEGETLWFKQMGEEELLPIELHDIQDVHWRGLPFQMN